MLSITPSGLFTGYSAQNINFNAKQVNPDSKNNSNNNQGNPITRKGETLNLIKATFVGGLALGARLLFELLDGDFLFESAGKQASKIVEKNKKDATAGMKDIYKFGAALAIIAAGISGFALLVTALSTPKIIYNSKVNTYKKQKEVDVYIKANEAEKNLYTEINERAKSADASEKEELKTQYMQMQMAKNDLPEFLKQNNIPNRK